MPQQRRSVTPPHKRVSKPVTVDQYVASENTVRKVVFLGNMDVGKTSIISRFMYDCMPPTKKSTIGALEHTKTY